MDGAAVSGSTVVAARASIASGRGASFRNFARGESSDGPGFCMSSGPPAAASSLGCACELDNASRLSGLTAAKSGTKRSAPVEFRADGAVASEPASCFRFAAVDWGALTFAAGFPKRAATPKPAATSAAATKSLRCALTAYLQIKPTSHVISQMTPNVEHDGFVRELVSRLARIAQSTIF
jgi:hypothetical protein